MPDNPAAVDHCVEVLCHHGCNKVYTYITLLEQGREFPEVAHLSDADRGRVLHQLVAIMKVYDGGVCGD